MWQLPQNVLAIVLIGVYSLILGSPERTEYKGIRYRWFKGWKFGISLGYYVILGDFARDRLDIINHEYGHTRQSVCLGPLYLIVIGLPSCLFKAWDRLFHTPERGWTPEKAYRWYFSLPWERWADKVGGVVRV